VQIPETCRMIYVLAYPKLEAKISRSLAAFRQTHEPERAQLVAPHITLVFGVRKSSPEEIAAICDQVASKTSAISTEFSKSEICYDPFEKVHKISLLCTKGAKQLTALHRDLYEGPHSDEFDTDIPFRPHMTVGANSNLSELEDVSLASIGTLPITAEIDSLSVVQIANRELQTICSVKLSM